MSWSMPSHPTAHFTCRGRNLHTLTRLTFARKAVSEIDAGQACRLTEAAVQPDILVINLTFHD